MLVGHVIRVSVTCVSRSKTLLFNVCFIWFQVCDGPRRGPRVKYGYDIDPIKGSFNQNQDGILTFIFESCQPVSKREVGPMLHLVSGMRWASKRRRRLDLDSRVDPIKSFFGEFFHRGRMHDKKMACRTWPAITSKTQLFNYGQSIFV